MPLSSSSLFPILSSPQICFTSSLHWSLNSPIMDFGIAKTFARLVLETTDFDNLYLFDFTSYTIWESSPIELNFSENLQLTRLDFLPISFPRLRFLFSNSIFLKVPVIPQSDHNHLLYFQFLPLFFSFLPDLPSVFPDLLP